VALVAPQKRLRLVAKGLGEQPLDILGAGDPLGDVFSAYCVRTGGRETCHCSRFSSCAFSPAAGGTGAKLSCSEAAGDPDCTAAAPCAGVPAGTCVDGDGCCLVACTPGSDDDCKKS
jgi:hypothetical protein